MSRELQATETSLHAKDRELSQTHRFLTRLNVMAFAGRVFGLIFLCFGLLKWWTIQRHEDMILKNKAERQRGSAA